MKRICFFRSVAKVLTLGAAVAASALATSPAAHAASAKAAIESRGELSEFGAFLDRTQTSGMLAESGYTVFAPVNGSFADYPAEKYPYLYSLYPPPAGEWAAKIARNHIVSGEVYLDDVTRSKGGVFSVDKRFIPVSEAPRGTYYVDGRRVLSMSMIGNGILYIIDGVIAKPWELVEIVPPELPMARNTTIVVPDNADVLVRQEISPGVTRTTAISPR